MHLNYRPSQLCKLVKIKQNADFIAFFSSFNCFIYSDILLSAIMFVILIPETEIQGAFSFVFIQKLFSLLCFVQSEIAFATFYRNSFETFLEIAKAMFHCFLNRFEVRFSQQLSSLFQHFFHISMFRAKLRHLFDRFILILYYSTCMNFEISCLKF